MTTKLPDLTDAAHWNTLIAQQKAAKEAEIEAQLEIERKSLIRVLRQAIIDGESYLRWLASNSGRRRDKKLMLRLCAWINAQPGYRCKMSQVPCESYYELHIRFRVINGKVVVRRPPFWVRWFC